MKVLCIFTIALSFLISCTSTQIIPPETDVQFWNNFRSEWIDLNSAKYKDYVKFYKNRPKFKNAPGPIYQEALKKWHGFFAHLRFPNGSTQTTPSARKAQYWISFRSEWIDLNRYGYKSYVKINAKKIANSPGDIYLESCEKWELFYRDEEFPPLQILQGKPTEDYKSTTSNAPPVDLIFDAWLLFNFFP